MTVLVEAGCLVLVFWVFLYLLVWAVKRWPRRAAETLAWLLNCKEERL